MVLRTQEDVLKTVVSAALDVLNEQGRQYEGGFVGEMKRLLQQHRGTDYLGWSPETRRYYHAVGSEIREGYSGKRPSKRRIDVTNMPGDLIDNPRDYKPINQDLPTGFQEAVLKELTSPR